MGRGEPGEGEGEGVDSMRLGCKHNNSIYQILPLDSLAVWISGVCLDCGKKWETKLAMTWDGMGRK